jgi:hypothetical protein
MQKFEMIIHGGHLLLSETNRLWVLDTGAPTSFGSHKHLEICGLVHPLEEKYMGLDASQLSRNLNLEVTGLIGGDILGQYDTHWDCRQEAISFTRDEIIPKGNLINLGFVMGIPTVSVKISDEVQTWFFDTGANICYVCDQPTSWDRPISQHEDFYPGYGSFQTEVFDAEICLQNFSKIVKCGILPEILGLSLSIGGCEGILGIGEMLDSDFYYSPRNRKLFLND